MSSFMFYLVGFLVISNPVGAVPIFCTLTQGRSAASRQRIARIAAITAFIVILTSLLAGKAVLEFFGISVASFRVAGGLLILMMAIMMIQGGSGEKIGADVLDERELGVTPMGIPMTAGPGAISTAILFADQADYWSEYAAIAGAALVTCFAIWGTLRVSDRLQNVLGQTGIRVVSRLMGLILAAIAVEFIVEGAVKSVQQHL